MVKSFSQAVCNYFENFSFLLYPLLNKNHILFQTEQYYNPFCPSLLDAVDLFLEEKVAYIHQSFFSNLTLLLQNSIHNHDCFSIEQWFPKGALLPQGYFSKSGGAKGRQCELSLLPDGRKSIQIA